MRTQRTFPRVEPLANGGHASAPYLASMRFLSVLSALVVWALASPAGLAEPCREMGTGRAGEPEAAGTFSDAQSGACCSVGSGCGVCCLAPTPVGPEPAPASVTVGLTAAVFSAVVLGPAAVGRVRHDVAPSEGRPPERPGASGSRGPPAR